MNKPNQTHLFDEMFSMKNNVFSILVKCGTTILKNRTDYVLSNYHMPYGRRCLCWSPDIQRDELNLIYNYKDDDDFLHRAIKPFELRNGDFFNFLEINEKDLYTFANPFRMLK